MGFDDLFKQRRNEHHNDGYYGGHDRGHHDGHGGIEPNHCWNAFGAAPGNNQVSHPEFSVK